MMRGTRLRDLLFGGAGTADALVEACYADRDDGALRALSPRSGPDAGTQTEAATAQAP